MTPARYLRNTPDQINSSNSTIRRRFGGSAGHHVSAVFASCAQTQSMPRRRWGRRAAKSIDGAEHSSKIERVMAGGSFPQPSGNVCTAKSGTYLSAISG
jgi:hypothetical protein